MSANERRLIIVTEVFVVQGRATCLLPVVPFGLIEPADGVWLRPGDDLELRKPDGTVSFVKLQGLEWIRPSRGGLVLTLAAAMAKEEIPSGTEIWKVEPQ